MPKEKTDLLFKFKNDIKLRESISFELPFEINVIKVPREKITTDSEMPLNNIKIKHINTLNLFFLLKRLYSFVEVKNKLLFLKIKNN